MSIPSAQPPSISLRAIYADDVRQEVDGKLTIVGVYQQFMIFEKFPAVIPKCAVLLTAEVPEDKLSGKFVFALYRDDEEEVFRAEIDSEQYALSKHDLDHRKVYEISVVTIQSCVEITKNTKFSTRLMTDYGVFSGRNIQIVDMSTFGEISRLQLEPMEK